MNLKRKVWIIEPYVHGNGGWYGWKILSSEKGMQLKRALSIDPYTKYDLWSRYEEYGDLGAIRICYKKDPNRAIYYFNDCEWKKI